MKSLRKWEIALLLALCFTLLAGTWAGAASSRVSEGLVRLHVIAASDDATEQAIKLDVRDAVLSYLEPKLDSAADIAGAEALIEANLGGIAAAAESAAQGREVNVTLGEEYYPTREYDTFSLPAGRYQSLRVTLGEGAGHNWWCVVFPPLCLTAAESEAAFEELDGETRAIISSDGGGVQFKFRLLELWGELMELLGA
ncbi:MAG TPA: stage II sporulation protein R [Candidatus Scatomorpha pullicola]|nr:stage II sporulation protein R [Candidatus Scatomorpha pullicola]